MKINGKGEGKEGVFCRCKGDYKREEKRKEEEIKGKIPRLQKGESMWGLFRGSRQSVSQWYSKEDYYC